MFQKIKEFLKYPMVTKKGIRFNIVGPGILKVCSRSIIENLDDKFKEEVQKIKFHGTK